MSDEGVMVACDGRHVWAEMFTALRGRGKIISPRGERTIEIEDYHIDLDPLRDRFCTYRARDLSLRYLAGEFGWYLAGDPNDTIIQVLSSFWGKISNPNGTRWNSNYGVPIFKKKQYMNCLGILISDPDSRQAVIVINRRGVAMSDSRDKICTNAIMFRIRDNKLNMTVQMRSNDIVRGLCYDMPIFSMIMEMMLVDLRGYNHLSDLQMGIYHHTSSSFHIYERHWPMMDEILDAYDKQLDYQVMNVPRIKSVDEVIYLQHGYPINMKRALVIKKYVSGWPFSDLLLEWIADDVRV